MPFSIGDRDKKLLERNKCLDHNSRQYTATHMSVQHITHVEKFQSRKSNDSKLVDPPNPLFNFLYLFMTATLLKLPSSNFSIYQYQCSTMNGIKLISSCEVLAPNVNLMEVHLHY